MRTPISVHLARCFVLLCALPVLLTNTTLARETDQAWSFERLDQRARAVAQEPFQPAPPLPEALQSLNYDTYRLIAFEHEQAIWKKQQRPFWLECFHRGYLFHERVQLHLIEEGEPTPLAYDPQLFQYRGELKELGREVPADVGFAGFRVLGKFDGSPHPLEIAALLGGCYFRAIGQGQVYGSSARALAIDIGLPKAEEFPVFREFWIERPKSGAAALRIWALLDSPSVAGAYQMAMHPGKTTAFDIDARLYFRHRPEKVGLAPITSMWMWGDGRAPPAGERRPKVHDSDGLLVQTAVDEWIWRPLTRLDYPSLTHYDVAGIRGFGLVQRDRTPTHFHDAEAKYHQRPTVWIEPKGGWDAGAVELLELPADHEGVDNIAAWWVPKQAIEVGKPLDLHYRVSFLPGDPPKHRDVGHAVALRVKREGEKHPRIEIDFRSHKLAQLAADAPVKLKLSAQRGKTDAATCTKQTDGIWRVAFAVIPESDAPVELSARLSHNDQPLTETWRYLCPK